MKYSRHVLHASLGAMSIFVIGVVVGVLGDRFVLSHSSGAIDWYAQHSDVSSGHESFLADMQRDLGLSAEQANHVQAILNRHQSVVNDAWIAVHATLQAAIDSVTSEIEQILSDDQRSALHEWLMQRHGFPVRQGTGEGR